MRDRLPEVLAGVTILVSLIILLSYMGTCDDVARSFPDSVPIGLAEPP